MKVKKLSLDEDFLMNLENPTPIRSITHFEVGEYVDIDDGSRVKFEFLFLVTYILLLPNLFSTLK
jgi:hypothetical protein